MYIPEVRKVSKNESIHIDFFNYDKMKKSRDVPSWLRRISLIESTDNKETMSSAQKTRCRVRIQDPPVHSRSRGGAPCSKQRWSPRLRKSDTPRYHGARTLPYSSIFRPVSIPSKNRQPPPSRFSQAPRASQSSQLPLSITIDHIETWHIDEISLRFQDNRRDVISSLCIIYHLIDICCLCWIFS